MSPELRYVESDIELESKDPLCRWAFEVGTLAVATSTMHIIGTHPPRDPQEREHWLEHAVRSVGVILLEHSTHSEDVTVVPKEPAMTSKPEPNPARVRLSMREWLTDEYSRSSNAQLQEAERKHAEYHRGRAEAMIAARQKLDDLVIEEAERLSGRPRR